MPDRTTASPDRTGYEGDQPLPTPGHESVFAEVHRRIDEYAVEAHRRVGGREEIGVQRYKISLQTFNGRDAGRDLEEELLDGLAYATQLRLERQALEARLAHALEQLRGVDALRLAAEARAEKSEAEERAFRFYSDEFAQGTDTAEDAAHAMFDAVVRHRLRAEKAEADLASHVEAQDRVIAGLKAQLAAARANWEAERSALEAETAARIQVEQQLRRSE